MQFLHTFSTVHAGILFNSSPLGNICILNVRLGGETDQQNVIMHKAYCEMTNASSNSMAVVLTENNTQELL